MCARRLIDAADDAANEVSDERVKAFEANLEERRRQRCLHQKKAQLLDCMYHTASW